MWLHVLGALRVSHGAFHGEPFGALRFRSERCWWQDPARRMESDDRPCDVVADSVSVVEAARGFAAPHACSPLHCISCSAFAEHFARRPLA